MPVITSIVQGQHKVLALQSKDSNGLVLDIDRVWFTLKRKETDPDSDGVQKSSHTSGGTATPTEIDIIDGPNGKADIKLVPADTRDRTPGVYLFDIWVRTKTIEDIIPVVEKHTFTIIPAISLRQVATI